jgi:hypothetical protein
MIKHRTPAKKAPKAKRSYTLSPESIEFLEALRKKRQTHSTSAVLEEILQTVRRGQKKKAVESAIADFYDSLPGEDVEEQARWGEFALGEFPI